MAQKIIKSYFYILSFFILFSCQKDEIIDIKNNINSNSKNRVSKDLAVHAANTFLKKYNSSNSEESRIVDVTRIVLNVFTYKLTKMKMLFMR